MNTRRSLHAVSMLLRGPWVAACLLLTSPLALACGPHVRAEASARAEFARAEFAVEPHQGASTPVASTLNATPAGLRIAAMLPVSQRDPSQLPYTVVDGNHVDARTLAGWK